MVDRELKGERVARIYCRRGFEVVGVGSTQGPVGMVVAEVWVLSLIHI